MADIDRVHQLTAALLFAPLRYKVKGSPILGRQSVVLLAKNIYSRTRVAIKFYMHVEQFEREQAALRTLSSE